MKSLNLVILALIAGTAGLAQPAQAAPFDWYYAQSIRELAAKTSAFFATVAYSTDPAVLQVKVNGGRISSDTRLYSFCTTGYDGVNGAVHNCGQYTSNPNRLLDQIKLYFNNTAAAINTLNPSLYQEAISSFYAARQALDYVSGSHWNLFSANARAFYSAYEVVARSNDPRVRTVKQNLARLQADARLLSWCVTGNDGFNATYPSCGTYYNNPGLLIDQIISYVGRTDGEVNLLRGAFPELDRRYANARQSLSQLLGSLGPIGPITPPPGPVSPYPTNGNRAAIHQMTTSTYNAWQSLAGNFSNIIRYSDIITELNDLRRYTGLYSLCTTGVDPTGQFNAANQQDMNACYAQPEVPQMIRQKFSIVNGQINRVNDAQVRAQFSQAYSAAAAAAAL